MLVVSTQFCFPEASAADTLEKNTAEEKRSGGRTKDGRTFLEEAALITDKFIEFMDRPTSQNYASGLAFIKSVRHFEPEADHCLIEGEKLLNENRFQEAINLVDGPDCIQTIFVPRHHYLMGAAFRHLSNSARADEQRMWGRTLLVAIAGSGDGSRERPFRVLHSLAEEDFVNWFLKDKIKDRKKQAVNVHVVLVSGKDIWFQAPNE